VEESDTVDAELNIRRSNVNQGREGSIKQTQAVADLKDKITKAKHTKQQLQAELAGRKESINEKEIKIEELTSKNITFEKHR
jgi:predicted  nucleic acid-binding Zn-ribbon protein